MSYPTSGSGPYPSPDRSGWDAPQQPAGYGAYPGSGYGAPPQPAGQMGMGEAVNSVLTQYATFSGRARRSEYWWFLLAYTLVDVVAMVVDAMIGTSIFEWVLLLGLLVPSVAVMVRRLHDIDRSGWWALFGLIPLVGGIVLLVFTCLDGQPGTNQWGPSPKYGA